MRRETDCIQSSFVGVFAFPGQWRRISVAYGFFYIYFGKLFLVFRVWLNKGSYTAGAVWCQA